jgi:hypothetical protein
VLRTARDQVLAGAAFCIFGCTTATAAATAAIATTTTIYIIIIIINHLYVAYLQLYT